MVIAIGDAGHVAQHNLLETSGWTSYVPTWTNLTLGDATVSARYFRVGNMVTCVLRITFGATTSVSGVFYPSLPVIQAVPSAGVAWAFDSSATAWATGVIVPGSYFLFGTARATTNSPFANWATGDIITFQFTYETS